MGFLWGPFWSIWVPFGPFLVGAPWGSKGGFGCNLAAAWIFLSPWAPFGIFGLPWCHLGHLYNMLLIYDSVTHYASSNRMICCTYPCVHYSIKLTAIIAWCALVGGLTPCSALLGGLTPCIAACSPLDEETDKSKFLWRPLMNIPVCVYIYAHCIYIYIYMYIYMFVWHC